MFPSNLYKGIMEWLTAIPIDQVRNGGNILQQPTLYNHPPR